MRLLLFSDVHCDLAACRRLVDLAQGVDVVVGAGDFATARRGLPKTIEALSGISCPVVLVPGNSESTDELRQCCERWPQMHVLHGAAVDIRNVSFFGVGGGIPVTPFGSWSFDFSEQQAQELLQECPCNGVLVTHSPPLGVLDCDSSGRSLGSQAIRQIVLQRTPQLLVCGHIHASWEQTARLGSTTVVNAGPRGVEFDLTAPESEPPPSA